MKKIMIMASVVLAALVLCAQADDKAVLPEILIIGDSISIGYTPPLTKILAGKAVVSHNQGNAAHSGNGLAKLEQWLGKKAWAVIHFNHGLHDLKLIDKSGKNSNSKETGHIQISLEQYEKNMEAIVLRLKKSGAKLIFATTTPYPETLGPFREAGLAEQYNKVALKVMAKHKVAVNDLYAFALPRLQELQLPNNVHFKPEGSKVLAEEVARHILIAIGSPDKF
ncbi:MAG: SGNH/GDSL hydrolase family protein [Kiritimatiellae bacterium]|nr:SGNH/GDSL hydrolase family protein [Kiritimatiellia bacterium]